MSWALILTIWANGPQTMTVTGFRSEAQCQHAAKEWRSAVRSDQLKFTSCVEERKA